MENYRIYIPKGTPGHMTAILEDIPEDCEIGWSNTSYEDRHKEGIIYLPDNSSYCIETV